MKLSELRPCDKCNGPLAPSWYVIKLSQCMLDRNATNQTLGLTQMFGGNLAIAELMGSQADRAVVVLGDEIDGLWTELLVCQSCVLGLKGDGEAAIDLGELMQNEMDRQAAIAEKALDGG